MKKLLLLIALSCWVAQAATYYVSTTGNASYDGSAPAFVSGSVGPKRTILQGIQLLSPGDTLIMRGGIYEEPSIDLPMSINGSSDANRTILKSYPGERAIFYPTTSTKHGINAAANNQVSSNLTFDGWTIDFRRKDILAAGHNSIGNFKMYWVTNLTLTNMHFYNSTNGSLTYLYTSNMRDTLGPGGNIHVVDCVFSNINNVQLPDGHIFDPIHTFYWNSCDDVIVERTLHIDGVNHPKSFGLHVYGGYQGKRWIVRNNRFENFSGGIALNARDSLVYNNVFVGIRGHGIGQYSQYSTWANNTVVAAPGGSTGGGIYTFGYQDAFINNIIWGTWGQGSILIKAYSDNRYITFTNNIVSPISPLPTAGNPYYTGTTFTDPLFVNSPTDVSLGVGSPAIKTGVDLSSLFTTDYTGATRTTPWDRGAYASEYAQGPEPEEPPPVIPADAIYVATTGSDSGAGTLASPYKTIKKGIEMLSAGGTLVLRGGTYQESLGRPDAMRMIPSGPSESQRTRIASYPGERAVWRPAFESATDIVHALGSDYLVSNMVLDSWTIDMQDRKDGESYSRGSMIKAAAKNVLLTNMWFINHPWGSGIQFQHGAGGRLDVSLWSSNANIVSCVFSNFNYTTPQEGHPIYSWGIWKSTWENNLFIEGKRVAIQYGGTEFTGTTSDLTIRNNRIMNGPTASFNHGIWNNSSPQDRGTNTWIYNNSIQADDTGIKLSGRTNYVFNNTIIPSRSIGFEVAGILMSSGYPHIVANNIVWGTPDSASGNSILNQTAYATSYLTNNIAGPKLPVLTLGNVTQSGNFWGPQFDPLFTDAPTDLRISNTGAAAGTGVNLGAVFNTDINGFTRQAWDIGAYAVGSQSGTDDPEEPPPVITYPRVSVTQAGPAYETGPTAATFTIFRDNFTDDLDVSYTLTGTAVEDTNFTISPASPVTIPGGQNSVTVTVTPIDTQYIGTLTVILSLDEDTAYTLSAPTNATMEIYGAGQNETGYRRTFGGPGALGRRAF